jgi:thiosulfate/3-mercaptopyruvate sulfurtransferase
VDLTIDVATLAAGPRRWSLSESAPASAFGPTLLDVRWSLTGPPGADEYAKGHLPGAVYVDLDADLCGPPGPEGRHPLPDPARLQTVLRAAGVRTGQPVVAYDGGDGQAAARTWWTLRWAGHDQVRVLDGGYAAWVAAGQPVTTDPPTPPPGDFTVMPGSMPVLDAAAAVRLASDGVLLDVRAAPRFRGEAEPIDPVAGHIPGAVNVPIGDDLALREALQDGVPIGAYCGSGVTAARMVLALHQLGRTDAALYVGSWSNWIADPARPVARGKS